MPNRILREGILSSERVNTLSAPAEVFYRRLMSVVDDFGRFYAKPELLRAACFPLKLDKVGNPDIGKWILETREAALVRTYTVDRKEYLELIDFRQQVRAKDSKFPHPSADAVQEHSACVADAQQLRTKTETYSKSETETGIGPKRGRQKAELQPLPENWTPSERTVARLTAEFKFSNGDAERYVVAFRDACAAKGYTYANFDSAFSNCVRKDWPGFRNGSAVMPKANPGYDPGRMII
jgi:hypothetical protein